MKILLLSLLVLLTQTATPTPSSPSPAAAPAAAQDYLVGPQDVLSIAVANHDNLSRRDGIAVEADGTIDYPLIGRIKVAGLSTRQIQEEITRRLLAGEYFTSVAVSVNVKEYRSQTVHVNGEVRTPGTVALTGVASVTEAISKAGHFTARAGQHVILVRGGSRDSPAVLSDVKPENQQIIPRADIETGRASKILVRDGDTILVPPAEVYYVTGHVQRPNEYIFKPELTVLQAITIAGGYTDRAAKNRIEIRRIVNGELKKLRVKEHDFVQPKDTIHVPQRWW